jgi:hypothetical protein
MWSIGLDGADTPHDVEVMDQQGKRVGVRRFAHSYEGLNALKECVLSRAPSPEHLAWIVETNHGLLITFLLEAGIPVDPVNPKVANQLRKAAGAKTDRIDAHRLSKMGRFHLDELRCLEPDSPKVAELKTLTRDQDGLVQMQTRPLSQLTACLKEYYPAALNLWSSLQQRSTVLFLQTYPTPQAVEAASLEEIVASLRKGKHPRARQVAATIWQEVHRPQLQASEIIVRTKSRLMLSLVRQLLVAIEEIAHYEKEIQTLFLTHPDQLLWSSLPGALTRLAPRLLAEWGDDRRREAFANSVQTLAGTGPVPFQSGNFAKAHKRLACLKPLRNVLHQFARATTRQQAWARDYYQRKRAEGKSHSMAVRALANIRVRIMYRMWQDQACYQPARFEQARQQHAQRAA